MSVRRRLVVTGTVQGVGFRPAVARAAAAFGLAGRVANTRGGAEIEVEGSREAVESFERELPARLPPRALVESIDAMDLEPRGEAGFAIRESLVEGPTRFSVPPDLAMCPACRAEFEDPGNRRHRHAFISCGDCGPRYSYILDLPYDRGNTTMASFPMCPACRAEYEDPRDRRYHIEGFCCPECGPVLEGFEGGLRALRDGLVVAVKGVGGYHLACLADEEGAVALLRRRKERPTKPLAVMYPSLAALEAAASLRPEELELLLSPEAPIVLVAKARFRSAQPESLAPDNPSLGLLLPYSPLHHLLLGELGRPLVMTSANMPGDPLIIDDLAAREGLRGVADAWISHGRRIARRADDGVAMACGRAAPRPGARRAAEPRDGGGDALRPIGRITRIRDGRGSVPRPRRLDGPPARSVLAVGAELKSTVSAAAGGLLVTSPHIGDLESAPAYESFRAAAEELLEYYGVEPEAVAADLHPDYESTRYAKRFAEERGIPVLRVQHHHAHLLSALLDLGELGGRAIVDGRAPSGARAGHGAAGASAERAAERRYLGLILDGTGYGPDGTIWGGEILVGGVRDCERVSHLGHLILPGGEAAVREPWRILAAHGLVPESSPKAAAAALIARIAADPGLSPRTSSCGRLFDAAAALLGFDRRVSYEGEAAIWLENLASESDGAAVELEHGPMDGLALLRALSERVAGAVGASGAAGGSSAAGNRGRLARLAYSFHRSLAGGIAEEARRVASERGLEEVFLSGGVFQNRIFLGELAEALEARGLEPRMAEGLPPNDACISVGQAAFALFAAL